MWRKVSPSNRYLSPLSVRFEEAEEHHRDFSQNAEMPWKEERFKVVRTRPERADLPSIGQSTLRDFTFRTTPESSSSSGEKRKVN